MNRGLEVRDIMGMHTANPISGDFSVGVSGIWIEKGKPSHPVRGGAVGSPSLLIGELSVSGD
jgi:PmbA protein